MKKLVKEWNFRYLNFLAEFFEAEPSRDFHLESYKIKFISQQELISHARKCEFIEFHQSQQPIFPLPNLSKTNQQSSYDHSSSTRAFIIFQLLHFHKIT